LILLLVAFAFVEASNVVCKTGSSSKTVTVEDGDSFNYKTQKGREYKGKTDCTTNYVIGATCAKMSFACTKFNINNRAKKLCRKGDKMRIKANGRTKSYCKNKKPEVTSRGDISVTFTSGAKKQATGATCTVSCVEAAPTACIESGVCFKGSLKKTKRTGTQYRSFQGIRYAQPPIDDLRFRPPTKFEYAQNQNVDVSDTSFTYCPQLEEITQSAGGSEDCLSINIYVPDGVTSTMPVMVWIYGGAFISGNNIFYVYGPENFMDQNIILVTINYRVGPFGFLSLGNEEVPGNMGLLDQRMAMEWVKEHISAFQPDEGKDFPITVFGESAGSASIAHHLLSPKSKGLFQRAILHSGVALSPKGDYALSPDKAITIGTKFMNNLGCDLTDTTCLSGKTVKEILANPFPLDIPGDALDNSGSAWLPVMDKEFTSDPFLPGYPKDLMDADEFNTEVDVIIGSTKDEGIYFLFQELFVPERYELIANDWNVYGPMLLFGIDDPEDISEGDVDKAQAILEFYTGDGGNYNEDHFMELSQMYGDAIFVNGIHKTVEAFLRNNMNVYQFQLTYQGEHSYTELLGIPPLGVCHSDDLIYLFDPVFGWDQDKYALKGEDALVRDFMTRTWSSFLKSGNPSSEMDDIWLPTTDDSFMMLNISGSSPEMSKDDDLKRRMEFWTNLMAE